MDMRCQNHRVYSFLQYIYMSGKDIYAIRIHNNRTLCLTNHGLYRL